MRDITGKAGMTMRFAVLAAVGALAFGAALPARAGQGHGPGNGLGCGASVGPGQGAGPDTPGAMGGMGRGCGAGPGMGMGPGGGRGPALLTPEERTAHHAKMQSLASYDECKAYMTEFSQQMQQRAEAARRGMRGPNPQACDRMKERGAFKP